MREMHPCGCSHCNCDCSDCLPPPSAEELAAEAAREEARLASRWTPARSFSEQMSRDWDARMRETTRTLLGNLERDLLPTHDSLLARVVFAGDDR